MAGNNNYYVGANQTYKEIQDAIDALISDQGNTAFSSEQRIIIAEDGIYAPFSIPDSALAPTSAARLVITSVSGVQATVSGLRDTSRSGYGAQIGPGVPYVTLQRILFRDLVRGAVFASDANYGVISQCTFLKCTNVGVWMYEAGSGTVVNSVFVNNEHGIATTRAKGISILSNTLFNDSGFTQNVPWLVFLDLREDNGGGEDDTGLAYLKNNVMFAQSGGVLLLYEKDVTNVRSDYNDWWSPGGGPLAEVREEQQDGTYSRDKIATLDALILRFGTDSHSVSEDPGFIKPSYDSDGANIDLSLLASSDVVGKAKKLVAADVENYVDLTLTDVDFVGVARAAQPTLGAHEKGVQASFYGHDLFDDTELPSDTCAGSATAFDRAIDKYDRAVEDWLPKIKSGYFYVRDHKYYLYSEKSGHLLGECAGSSHQLSAPLVSVTSVRLHGQDVTDVPGAWSSDGLSFNVLFGGVDGVDIDSDVEIVGNYRVWDSDSGSFEDMEVTHRFKVGDGALNVTLQSNPVPGTPIVITDDRVRPWDRVGVPREFSTEYDAEHDVTNIRFHGATNLWRNPTPFFYTGDSATYWETTDGWSFVEDSTNALKGIGYLSAETGDWTIGQRFPVTEDNSFVLSCYACCLDSGETGSIGLSIQFLDEFNHEISTSGPYVVSLTGDGVEPIEWTRLGVEISNQVDHTPDVPELSSKVATFYAGVSIPSLTKKAFIKFHSGSGARIGLTCVQLEAGNKLSPFNDDISFSDITIEYESSTSPFHVPDLNIHPVRNGMNNGFLTITPVSLREWDEDAPYDSTTLSDSWATARVEILPWAKIEGYNKMRRVVRPSLERQPIYGPAAELPSPILPLDIRITPSLVIAKQDSDGEAFSIEVFDEKYNPYAFEIAKVEAYDETGEFPGYLSVREWGFYTQLGQAAEVRLDEGGSKSFVWIPPGREEIEYRGDVPEVLTGDTSVSISTKYEVYEENHGNAKVIDQYGNILSDTGELTTEYIAGTTQDGYTYFETEKFPVIGSVELLVDGDYFEETIDAPIGERQFLVDYSLKRIFINSSIGSQAQVSYSPRLVWRDPFYPRSIRIDRSLIEDLTGDISVVYDAKLRLMAIAEPPSFFPDAVARWTLADLVAQHGVR